MLHFSLSLSEEIVAMLDTNDMLPAAALCLLRDIQMRSFYVFVQKKYNGAMNLGSFMC